MKALGALIERAEAEPAGKPDATLLGLAFVVASDLMFLNAFSPHLAGSDVPAAPAQGSPFHVVEMMAFLAGALVCALALMAAVRVGRRRGTRGAGAAGRQGGPDGSGTRRAEDARDVDGAQAQPGGGAPEVYAQPGGGAPGRRAGAVSPALAWRALLVLGVACSALGLAAVWAHGFIPVGEQSVAYALACGVPLGVGNTLLHVLWGRAYTALPPRRCLAHASVSFAAGITVSVAVSLLGGGAWWAGPAVWTACQVLACVLVALRLCGARQGGRLGAAAPGGPTTEPVPTPDELGRPTGRAVALYLWMALAGQFAFCLLMGVYWGTYSLAIFHGPALEAAVSWFVALTCLAVACLGVRARRPVGFGLLYRVAVPVGAVLLVSDPFLSLMGVGDMFVTSGVSWSACFTAFGVVAWVATAQACRFAGRAPEGLFSLSRALWAAGLALGVVLAAVASAFDVKMVLSAVMVAFLVAVFVVQFVLGGRGDAGEGRVASEPPTPGFDAWVAQAAERYGLSEREGAVFSYLAQGRGEAFVAEALCISTNTVKTHRKHIYRKLGVSGREELLDLVVSQTSGRSAGR